MIKSRFQQKFN